MEGTRRNQAAAHRVDLVNPHAQEGHIAPSSMNSTAQPCPTLQHAPSLSALPLTPSNTDGLDRMQKAEAHLITS